VADVDLLQLHPAEIIGWGGRFRRGTS
jgi:hypothetical protein